MNQSKSNGPGPIIFAALFALAGLAVFTWVLVNKNKKKEKEKVEITDPESLRIEIDKSRRTLVLYQHDDKVREYRVGLGFQPEGDKEVEGDGKTPEGEFFICMKNPNSQYFRSLGLSYPNMEDAQRGKSDGIISAGEFNSITSAIKAGKKPLWKTALGGEIFIHGHGASSDWTLGCIALDDEAMEELYNLIPAGAIVLIRA